MWLFLIIPAVVVSALWMYRKTKFPTRTRYLLSALRVLVLLALGILLLRPVFTSYNRELIKPVLAILVDNSKSITANEDSLEIKSAIPTQIAELEKSLADKYQVDVYLFDETARVSETPNFDGSYTNLSASLKTLEDNYDPKDLREVVIFSDGIINQGSDPNYIPPSYFKTHVVMLGNPEKEEDLSIASLEYNPSVYRGNTLALTVNWQNTGQSKKARLRVKKG
ncbi:MAG: vWA domain-containing protein, partial [Luteibaculum sp.]